MVHEGLEHSGSIGKSHQHDQELEGAITCSEGCLPLVAHCNVNIVVASAEVELGDERNQILILPCDLVEVLEVHTESQGAILLLRKENWGTAW